MTCFSAIVAIPFGCRRSVASAAALNIKSYQKGILTWEYQLTTHNLPPRPNNK